MLVCSGQKTNCGGEDGYGKLCPLLRILAPSKEVKIRIH